jgi:hypothetical protein
VTADEAISCSGTSNQESPSHDTGYDNVISPPTRHKVTQPDGIEFTDRSMKTTVTANVPPPGTSSAFPGGTETRPIAVTVPPNSDSYRIS